MLVSYRATISIALAVVAALAVAQSACGAPTPPADSALNARDVPSSNELQRGLDFPQFAQPERTVETKRTYGENAALPWYRQGSAFPRQLAPKFKRELDLLAANAAKRYDDEVARDLFLNHDNGRLEWNFNRL